MTLVLISTKKNVCVPPFFMSCPLPGFSHGCFIAVFDDVRSVLVKGFGVSRLLNVLVIVVSVLLCNNLCLPYFFIFTVSVVFSVICVLFVLFQ